MELYDILNENAIEGSISNPVEITTHGAVDDETTWTDILVNTQNLPAGDYQFLFDWVIEGVLNEAYFWRIMPDSSSGEIGPELPAAEIKTERQDARMYFQYGFPYSWDSGDFTFRLQFKAKQNGGLPAFITFSDFTMTRRS